MNINFDILSTLLFSCESSAGKTIIEMKGAIESKHCPKQVQKTIDYMVNKKMIIALPGTSKDGIKMPDHWKTNRFLRNATSIRAR